MRDRSHTASISRHGLGKSGSYTLYLVRYRSLHQCASRETPHTVAESETHVFTKPADPCMANNNRS